MGRTTKIALASTALLLGSAGCALIGGFKDRELAQGDDAGEDGATDGTLESGADHALLDVPADSLGDTPGDGGVDASADASDALDAFDGNCGADVMTDPSNCGRCSHNCLGGACEAGSCGPVEIAPLGGTPISVAVDSTSVYWANNKGGSFQIGSCPKTGCGDAGATVLQTPTTTPSGVVSDGMNVYWTEANGPFECKITICSATNGLPVAIGQTGPSGIFLGATDLYWGNNVPMGFVYTCHLGTTCNATMPTPLASAALSDGPTSLAGDAAGLAWIQGGGSVWTLSPPLPTGTLKDLGANNLGAGGSIAVDATHVYFTGQAAVYSCPRSGGCATPPTSLATFTGGGTGTLPNLVVDATNLYWLVNPVAGFTTEIAYCPLSSCMPNNFQVLATDGSLGAHGLAQDANALYFGFGNSIMKIAKP